jgi:hypothetical protein
MSSLSILLVSDSDILFIIPCQFIVIHQFPNLAPRVGLHRLRRVGERVKSKLHGKGVGSITMDAELRGSKRYKVKCKEIGTE